VISSLSKPHYVYRPDQLVRRALASSDVEPVVRTPWGCELQVARADKLGAGIARTGVHELAVSEVIWRLAGGDELAIDVGANVGYFTGLLARRARRVVALEPNPLLRRFIAGNIDRWNAGGRVVLDDRAASCTTGATTTLHLPRDYEQNYGLASLEPSNGTDSHQVETVRLDDVIAGRRVGVLKIDVEGHELTALDGAFGALSAELIRDVVFEELGTLPSPVSELLESFGFAISGIEEGFTGPRLAPPDRPPAGWDAPTYLATRDRLRTERLTSARGWHCLRPRRSPGARRRDR
jgi:FkbM family methyltransferase